MRRGFLFRYGLGGNWLSISQMYRHSVADCIAYRGTGHKIHRNPPAVTHPAGFSFELASQGAALRSRAFFVCRVESEMGCPAMAGLGRRTN
jgi:hypothetical protein